MQKFIIEQKCIKLHKQCYTYTRTIEAQQK